MSKQSNTIGDDTGAGGASLPEDQVLEVLTRVPLDDLAACRVVSTRWRSITYDPAFAPLHCRRTATVSGYFLQGMERNRHRVEFVSMHASPAISLDFLPSSNARIEAVAAHRGLACCVGFFDTPRRRPPCYYVCKPATRQWRALPSPRTRFHTAAMAMAAKPCSNAAVKAEFKIVRFSIPKVHNYLHCEVFDSRRFAWRRAPDVHCEVSLPLTPAVGAHGAVHWLRWYGQDVFAFDLESEAWRVIALPREVDERRDPRARKQLSAVAGRLCLLVTTTTEGGAGEEVMGVWEIANYAEGSWERKMTVSLKSLRAEEGAMMLRHLYSSDVGFLDSLIYKDMWYDFRRGKKVAEVKVDQACVEHVFKFESDMIPCKLR
ncbi:hypothetical protein HU200_062070 [Digitaria exilis]|uniref:F-box domain-containing protein n=1 Tax=Digitaria exilis TaxID=1010633 RepID=A0A835DW83_9POAL|nr:hypothetical protein HU200_062070 [Digitaria exilis]